MHSRPFGRTGLTVSALGFGAGHIGSPDMGEDHAARILNTALDLGISFIDTARGYGLSEERIGRHIAHRRGEYVLATKCGYGIDGVPDWTAPCIAAGVDAALSRLRTDTIDVMLFHSCPLDVVRRDDLVEALENAVRAGKVRVAGYSGENQELLHAVSCGRFHAVETSVNLFDQWSLANALPVAETFGIGVIAKRPLGNAPWRFRDCPHGNYAEEYWHRMQALKLDPHGLEWQDFALRFAAFAPGVSTAIAGTGSIENLRRNVAAVEQGPLPAEIAESARRAYAGKDPGWRGQV